MSSEKDPLEEQARNLVTASSILSISLHRSFSQKSTEIERNFDKWEFFVTIAGVYYGVAGLAVKVLPGLNRYDSLNAVIQEGLDGTGMAVALSPTALGLSMVNCWPCNTPIQKLALAPPLQLSAVGF